MCTNFDAEIEWTSKLCFDLFIFILIKHQYYLLTNTRMYLQMQESKRRFNRGCRCN